jgi:hypothetical protein
MRACSMSGEWMFFPEWSALMAQRMTYVGCVAFAHFLLSRGKEKEEGLVAARSPVPRSVGPQ